MQAAKIFFVLLIIGFVVAGYAVVRRTMQRRAAWESGLTAPGRVVRAWQTTQIVNNVARRVQWHEYDYTTRDNRAVRFEEGGGPRDRGVGDEVVVYYSADEPERATACAPQPGKDTASMVFGLLILGSGIAVMIHLLATTP